VGYFPDNSGRGNLAPPPESKFQAGLTRQPPAAEGNGTVAYSAINVPILDERSD